MAKFNIDIPRGTESLSIKDYRVLLGALHDGFTWYNGDKSQYICPDLCKPDTIVSVLYWAWMMKNAKYQPLIDEAFLYVEEDIREKGLLDEGEKTKESKDKPTVPPFPFPVPIPIGMDKRAAEKLEKASQRIETATERAERVVEELQRAEGERAQTGAAAKKNTKKKPTRPKAKTKKKKAKKTESKTIKNRFTFAHGQVSIRKTLS